MYIYDNMQEELLYSVVYALWNSAFILVKKETQVFIFHPTSIIAFLVGQYR
jgi:hypothetical protein